MGESVFVSDRDKQDFLGAIGELKATYAFKLFAFALLESHVHLVLCPRPGDVGQIMSSIIASYARQHNRRSSHTGYVFKEEYECQQCHSDQRILPLIRFIHYLPVQHGHCHHPNLARWTSHLAYLGDPRYSLVDSADIFGIIAGEKSQALPLYQGLMARPNSGRNIADSFVSNSSQPVIVRESDHRQSLPRPLTLEDIAEFIAKATGVSIEVMRGKGRAERVVEARRMFIAAAVMVCYFPVSDVAKYLNVHHSYVSRLTFPRSEASKAMARTAEEMAAALHR